MKIKVTRAQVYAARALVHLGDKRPWVQKLAQTPLGWEKK